MDIFKIPNSKIVQFFLSKIIRLPKPTGKYIVGVYDFICKDINRKDPIFKENFREIPVRCWYPAESTKGCKRISYIKDSNISRHLTNFALAIIGIKGDFDFYKYLTKVKTHGYLSASIKYGDEKYPVVFFGHGNASPNWSATLLCEELASRGYIVVAPTITYVTSVSVFDEKIVGVNEKFSEAVTEESRRINIEADKFRISDPGEWLRLQLVDTPEMNKIMNLYLEDTISVLDYLYKINNSESAAIISGKMDLNKVGIFGHSMGGGNAGRVCFFDKRFKAGINMDGGQFGGELIENIIDQPFMVLCSGIRAFITGYHSNQKNIMFIGIKNSTHGDFGDGRVIDLGLKSIIMKEGAESGKNISEPRMRKILRDLVVGFFDINLKGKDASIEQIALVYKDELEYLFRS